MIIVLAIIIVFGLLIYRTFVQKIIREKNVHYEKEIEHQKAILTQEINVQESERERIATLLHDDVGSKLNILSVWLNNEDTWNNERSKEVITKQIPELINATRNISHSLYPVNLERFGLIMTLEELISNIESSLSITLVVHHNYEQKNISFEVQLYRIIQEFISNVIKHAQASEMTIQVRDTTFLTLILSDNGIGFNMDTIKKGMGLKNIESRIKSMNGSWKWKSKKNNGFKLITILPLK